MKAHELGYSAVLYLDPKERNISTNAARPTSLP